ncbi:YggT family protein [Kiloniella sp.]|uniref:YggT family protein n=1 Tax=Kiloniella sp. TaxID=1938587 RepID=UPI003B01DA16
MEIIIGPLILVAQVALNLFWWALVISAILSWLVAFNVINTSNQFVNSVGSFLYSITEPALRPIRRFVPPLGGLDMSFIVLLLIILFVQNVLARLQYSIG